MTPHWLLSDPRIPDRVIRIYGLLAYTYFAGDDWPSRRDLARHCGVSVDSVDRAIRTAVGLGVLSITQRRNADGGLLPNGYTLATTRPTELGRDTGGTGGRNG